MADEEKPQEDNEEIVVKKSGSKQIMIMFVLCIAVIVLTPVAVLYALKIFDGTEPEKTSAEPDKYNEVTMEEISVNISRSSGQHVILVEVTIHLTSEPEMLKLFEKPAEGSTSLLKVFQAEIIDILRTKVMEDLEAGNSVKKKLEKDIKLTLNKVKAELAPHIKGQVLRVYFSRYMLQ
ncbi:MAG: flagellar basal body-associated FliL family protein [Lentisphaeraceae bacterium]|nr:flagellar basal body-associated FliL family protein [Lentisphaeraceae bacterium]